MMGRARFRCIQSPYIWLLLSTLNSFGQITKQVWCFYIHTPFTHGIYIHPQKGGKYGDVSIWKPLPPEDYVVLGYILFFTLFIFYLFCNLSNSLYSDIAAKGHGVKPDPSLVQCVHKSLVQKAVVLSKEYLWGSKNSSAATHASVWMMTDLQGVILPTFTAMKARKGKLFWHYDPPKYDVFCLNV